MKINKLLHLIKPPCKKCPYTLRQVQFVDNPCPNCKLNNYQMYYRLMEGKHKPWTSMKKHSFGIFSTCGNWFAGMFCKSNIRMLRLYIIILVIYRRRGILLSKNKILDMVLLAASVILAVAKAIVEQEKPKDSND